MAWQHPREAMDAIWKAMTDSDELLVAEISSKAVEEFPDSPELWAIRAYVLFWNMQRAESAEALRKAFELGSQCAVCQAVQAALAALDGKPNEAQHFVQQALELDGEDHWVLWCCLDAFNASGNVNRATDMALRMCHLYPNDPLAYYSLISMHRIARRISEARMLLQEAEQRFADSAIFWCEQAQLMWETNTAEAIGLLEKAIAKSPGYASLWNRLSSIICTHRKDLWQRQLPDSVRQCNRTERADDAPLLSGRR